MAREARRGGSQAKRLPGPTGRRSAHARRTARQAPRSGRGRKTAQRELEALKDHEESIAELEADRDAILQYYEKMTPDALDSLTTEERRHFYTLLRLEVLSAPDSSLSLSGAAFPEEISSVCESSNSHLFRAGPSWSAERKVIYLDCTA